MMFWFRSNVTMARNAFGPCSDLNGTVSSEQWAKVRKHTFCQVAFQGGRRIERQPVVYVCSVQPPDLMRAGLFGHPRPGLFGHPRCAVIVTQRPVL